MRLTMRPWKSARGKQTTKRGGGSRFSPYQSNSWRNGYQAFQQRRREAQQRKKQYPVSSGSQHRAKEGRVVQPAHMQLNLNDTLNTQPSQTVNTTPAPAPSCFGYRMLQKMGWSPGEGLGKYKEGTTEPIIPDGMDYYVQQVEVPKKQHVSLAEDLSGKHPVMALTELCTKFSWSAPKFVVVNDVGPDHKKNFLMKVIVNGQEFQPEEAAANKKQAKADAAALFLASIGLNTAPKGAQ